MEDKRRKYWEDWKDHYFRRYGVRWKGETFLTIAERVDEIRWKELEKIELKVVKEWRGQESADKVYNGIFNTKLWTQEQIMR